MLFSTTAQGLLAFTCLCAVPSVFAHSWVEEMYVIGSNGTFVGEPGYARANVQRAAGVNVDLSMVYLLPPNGRAETNITTTDPMCMSTQTIGSQSSGSPKLVASPGDQVALRYQENGHVTLPQNQPGKPANRGTVYIYATQKPSNSDTLLEIHKVWNEDGSGGDGRGFLLATRNFDDGQCYQINSGNISTARQAEFPHEANALMGADLWCQNDIQIPTDVSTSSDLTLYWVWDWPTAAGTTGFPDGKEELYTTCIDIALDGTSSSGTVKEAVSFEKGQSLNSAAIVEQLTVAYQVTGTTTDNTYNVPAATGKTSAKASSAATTTSTASARSGAGVFADTGASAAAKGSGGAVSTVTVDQTVTTTVDQTVTKTVDHTVTVTVTGTEGPATLAVEATSTTRSGHPVVTPFINAGNQASSTTSTTTTTQASYMPRIRGRNPALRPLKRSEVLDGY